MRLFAAITALAFSAIALACAFVVLTGRDRDWWWLCLWLGPSFAFGALVMWGDARRGMPR